MFIRGRPDYLIPQKVFTPRTSTDPSRPFYKPLTTANDILGLPNLVFCSIFNDVSEANDAGQAFSMNYAVGQPYQLVNPYQKSFTAAPGPFGGLYLKAGTATIGEALPMEHGTISIVAKNGGGGFGVLSNVVEDRNPKNPFDSDPDGWLMCRLPYIDDLNAVVGAAKFFLGTADGLTSATAYLPQSGWDSTRHYWHHWAYSWGRSKRTQVLGVDYGPPGSWVPDTLPSLQLVWEDGTQRVPLNIVITDAGNGYPVGSHHAPLYANITIIGTGGRLPALVGVTNDQAPSPFHGHIQGIVRASDHLPVTSWERQLWEMEPQLIIDPPWTLPGGADPSHGGRQAKAVALLPHTRGRSGGRLGGALLYASNAFIDSLWIWKADVGAFGWNDPYAPFGPFGIPIHVHIEPAQNGEVTEVRVDDPGSGYAVPPAVYFQGGWGSETRAPLQPIAHAVLSGDKVDSIVLDYTGRNYNIAPAVILSGNAKATAKLTRTIKRVEFYANKEKIGESYSPPFSHVWLSPIHTPRTTGCHPPDLNYDRLEARLICEERSFDSAPVDISVL